MRLVRRLGLALALAIATAAAAPALAQVGTAPLAPGEVLLQITALGQVTTPADRAVLTVLVTARGADGAAARRALRARLVRLRAELAAAGVAGTDIGGGDIQNGVAYSQLPYVLMIHTAAAGFGGVPDSLASAVLTVTVRNMAQLGAVSGVLTGDDLLFAPEYSLADSEAALREARLQALRKARADAEAYAAPLDLRVVRIVRVTDRIGLDGLGVVLANTGAIGRLFGRLWQQSSEIESLALVGVDFALAPR